MAAMTGSCRASTRALPASTRERTSTLCALLAGGLMAVASVGCSGDGRTSTEGRGTLVISTGADADQLFPPLASTTLGKAISDQLFEPLASVGDSLNVIGDRGFIPGLADSWDWSSDSLSIAFHLNPRALWHDGQPVTAADVRFSYRIYVDSAVASPSASLFANVDSVSVAGPRTAVFWFRRRSPQQFYVAANELDVIPQHVYGNIAPGALASSAVLRKPVGSGRFRFARWVPGASVEIVSNQGHYRAPARLDRVIWTIAPDYAAAAARFMSGEADFLEAVRPEMLPQIRRSPNLVLALAPGFKYGYMALNLHSPARPGLPHPIFGDRDVRRAIAMAVNRTALVRSVFDTLAVPSVGPVVRAMPTSDTGVAPLPYAPGRAAQLLDSLGWRATAPDGIRRRNGVPLRFTIITPASSKDRARLAVLIQEQLRRVGVVADVRTLELNTLIQQLATRDFDAVMVTWSPDPNPSAIKESWGSESAHARGSANYSGYSSALFDAELDSAASATSLAEARPLFARAYQTIVNDAPAVWLFEPRSVFGVQRRIHLATLRPDAWWAHLADWYVPADERIARDRVRRAPAGAEERGTDSTPTSAVPNARGG